MMSFCSREVGDKLKLITNNAWYDRIEFRADLYIHYIGFIGNQVSGFFENLPVSSKYIFYSIDGI